MTTEADRQYAKKLVAAAIGGGGMYSHCVSSGAGELIERAEAVRVVRDFVNLFEQPSSPTKIAAQEILSLITALPTIQPAAACGCRAVVEKIRDESSYTERALVRNVANTILAALPAPAEGEAMRRALIEKSRELLTASWTGFTNRDELVETHISALEKVKP